MKKIANIVIIVILLIIIVFCGIKVYPDAKTIVETKKQEKVIYNIIEETTEEEEEFSHETFNKLYEMNNDLKGYLMFDTGILSKPVVQSYDNDFYLRKGFTGSYHTSGTAFMDYACTLDSTNITIYGHNVYYDDSAMFSPISFLVEQDYYDENSEFSFYLDNEVRHYQITNVYYITMENPEHRDFARSEFESPETFAKWYEKADTLNLIKSKHGSINYGDKILTLQTCRRWDDDRNIIVVAKEVSRSEY